VIGAGSAGLVSAYIAATVKARVTLIESEKMGGDCLNYGCVPSKALIKSARVAHLFRQADRYGLQTREPGFSFRAVMERVHEIIRTVEPHDSIERYTNLGVEVLQGYGKLVDPWTVEITMNDGSTRRLTSRSIVIAAGARPLVPPIPGLDEVGYVTSDTLWDRFAERDEAPRRLAVLGGGPIGRAGAGFCASGLAGHSDRARQPDSRAGRRRGFRARAARAGIRRRADLDRLQRQPL
jgi:pyruvate/2-oxoglutarate dehydrogenase complex dihydrolipoamide dehydrogenase (E3) component